MNRVIVIITGWLLAGLTTYAQSNQQELSRKTDVYISRLLKAIPDLPGVAVVVVKDDQPVFMKAYGWADKENNISADQNTLYYIASATKSFTAMGAALLDREGKIKLDDPMRKYLPGFVFKHPIPENRITMRELLTHTSGVENDPLTFRVAYTGDVEKKALLKVFRDETIWNDSSYRKYNYDNLGYNVYSLILEQYLGVKWQDLLQERLFTPLGMHRSTTYISKAHGRKWTIAAPYLAFGEKGLTRSWLDKKDNNMQSAGGIFMSIHDAATWIAVNMNGGKIGNRQVIPAEVIRTCHTGYTDTEREVAPFTGKGKYGLGWQIGTYNHEKVIYHFGGFPGYSSHISFMPDQHLGVAIFINEGNMGSRVMSLISTYAYDLWLQQNKNTETLYEGKLKELIVRIDTSRMKAKDMYADRAKRPWLLSYPLAAYTGTYQHPYFGTIHVFIKNNTLAVKMGNMECTATPYTNKEAVRVELIPGSGQSLQFTAGADGKIGMVEYDKTLFRRKQ